MIVGPILAAALAFNLFCAGTKTTQDISGKTSEDYRYVYRIDLGKKQYCSDDCRAIASIAEIQPTKLILENSNSDTPSGRSLSYNTIDRETGAQQAASTSSQRGRPSSILILGWKGTCERQPFGGFPSFDTKF